MRYVIVTGGVSVRVVTVRDVPVRRVIVYGPRGKMNVPQRIMRVYSQRLVPVRLVPVRLVIVKDTKEEMTRRVLPSAAVVLRARWRRPRWYRTGSSNPVWRVAVAPLVCRCNIFLSHFESWAIKSGIRILIFHPPPSTKPSSSCDRGVWAAHLRQPPTLGVGRGLQRRLRWRWRWRRRRRRNLAIQIDVCAQDAHLSLRPPDARACSPLRVERLAILRLRTADVEDVVAVALLFLGEERAAGSERRKTGVDGRLYVYASHVVAASRGANPERHTLPREVARVAEVSVRRRHGGGWWRRWRA